MSITPRTRRDLILAYAVILMGAWMLAYGFAALSHSIQHAWLPTPYLLLPISLISFHLLPLGAGGILAVAVLISGWRRTSIVAAVLVAVFTTARVFYWWNVASRLATLPTEAGFANLAAARPPAFWAVSVIGLSAYIALAMVVIGTMRDLAPSRQPKKPLPPTSGRQVGVG